jgi:hypothetical protein
MDKNGTVALNTTSTSASSQEATKCGVVPERIVLLTHRQSSWDGVLSATQIMLLQTGTIRRIYIALSRPLLPSPSVQAIILRQRAIYAPHNVDFSVTVLKKTRILISASLRKKTSSLPKL